MSGGPMPTTRRSSRRCAPRRAGCDRLAVPRFGFERIVVPGEDGTIAHAALTFGIGMIMLGTGLRDDDYNKLIVAPADAGGVTQAPYIVVDDADAHYAGDRRGAEIAADIADWDHGGRGYSCRDPEGNVWNFALRPWARPEAGRGAGRGTASPSTARVRPLVLGGQLKPSC